MNATHKVDQKVCGMFIDTIEWEESHELYCELCVAEMLMKNRGIRIAEIHKIVNILEGSQP